MDLEMYHAVEDNDPVKLRRCLDAGGDVNAFYQDMTLISAKSILHMCCEKGRIECVKVLLEKGADMGIRDTWYQTPLMYCMRTQWVEVGELLLEHNSRIVDTGDKYGKCALHIAVEVGSIECIEVLLRHGADVDVQNNDGVTPLSTICGDRTVASDVLVKIVKLLIDAGADPNIKDFRECRSALQRAMLTANVEVVEYLLSVGAIPNELDSGGRCPITNILWYHRHLNDTSELDDELMLIIIMLIQAGANLNLSSKEQSNALCMATLYRLTTLVEYFLHNGADQNADFYCGTTPLQIAVRKRDLKTIKVLLNWNSDLYRKGRVIRGDLDYMTDAFHLAMDIGSFEAGILLVEMGGYDLTRVSYLTDWSKTPPAQLLQNPTMLDYFRQGAGLVPSLFRLVIFTLRKRFRGSISEQAMALPLPKMLIRAVQLDDFT
ncbi:Ankyrin repeat and SOCS box protein 10 [Mactra antiquata]